MWQLLLFWYLLQDLFIIAGEKEYTDDNKI